MNVLYLTNDSLVIGYRMHYNTPSSPMCYRVIYENWKIYYHQGYPRGIVRCRECERSQEETYETYVWKDERTAKIVTTNLKRVVKITRPRCRKYVRPDNEMNHTEFKTLREI